MSENHESLKYLVCEGVEDALSLRINFLDHHILISFSKNNLEYVPEFLCTQAEVLILSDHDPHKDPQKNGQTFASLLMDDLERKGFRVDAKIPPVFGDDANKALQEGRLEQFLNELLDLKEIATTEKNQLLQVPQDRGFRLIQRKEFFSSKPNWLVQGLFESETLALLVGASGCCKTFLALDFACSITSGKDWNGRAVKKGLVVYLCGEGESGLGRRINVWESYHSVMEVPLWISNKPLDLKDAGNQLPKVKE